MIFRRVILSTLFFSCTFFLQAQAINNDSIKEPIANNKELKHSPSKAMLYSAILPGLGQVYNKQVWKVPIVYVAGGAITYFAITNYQGAQKFKKEYRLRTNNITEGRNPEYSNYPDESIYNLYYAYQKNFELSIIGGVLIYTLNVLDAFVYGHLFSYDLSPNLSMKLTPYCLPPSMISNSYFPASAFGISMSLNFK